MPKSQTDCLRQSHRLDEPWTRHSRWKCMEESHQEVTEKEVEFPDCCRLALETTLIFQCSFFYFVIDPSIVGNIFPVCFIIRDAFARVRLDQDLLSLIEPVMKEKSEEIDQNT